MQLLAIFGHINILSRNSPEMSLVSLHGFRISLKKLQSVQFQPIPTKYEGVGNNNVGQTLIEEITMNILGISFLLYFTYNMRFLDLVILTI